MLTLLLGAALAGTLTIDADRPVDVRVNGVPVAYDYRARRATVSDLSDGVYAVEVATPEGARIGQAQVAVTAELPGALVLRGGALDRMVSARATAGEGRLLFVTPLSGKGQLQVELDGRAWTASAAQAVPAGARMLRLRVDGATRFEGTIDVLPGMSTVCLLSAALRCELQSGGVTSAEPAKPPAPEPPKPPVSTEPVTVTFVLKDSFDLSNVYVDGKRVAEFRTNDKEKSVTLSPGVHTIEIREFTEFETWAKGTLLVTPGDPIRVGFDEESVEVYNRQGAWTPGR